MRVLAITMLLGLAGGCAKSASFPDAARDAAGVRLCFESLAPVEIPEKAKLLAPCAEKSGPALVARLEAMDPPGDKVDCHADALAGARRAVGAMQDLLKVYRRNTDTGTRAVASARNIDEGLTQLEGALAACTK
jgi:hypothetical protein